jgi:hypothetical protein
VRKWLYTNGLPAVASSGVRKGIAGLGNTAAGKLLNNVFVVLAEGANETQGIE